MGFRIPTILLIVFILLASCQDKSRNEVSHSSSHSDSVWLTFLNAMESKDIKFLLANSADTIQCAECNLDQIEDKEYYNSDLVFTKHLDKLMHLPNN